jgi:hypothetical protein
MNHNENINISYFQSHTKKYQLKISSCNCKNNQPKMD